MKYAVIEITGPYQGFIIKRAILVRSNRVFIGSYRDCAAWIAGFKAALAAQLACPAATRLRLLPSTKIEQAS